MNPEPKSATETTLFRNRNYRFLLVADILSSPGYYIYIIAVEWLMLTLYDSRSYLGLMLFSSSFARLLFTIYGGIIADRLNRKLIILVTQWGEAFIIAAILLCYIADVISPVFLIVASFLFGILSAFASPAYESIITSIVEKSSLQRGNALLRLANQYSLIIGPLISSTLIVTIGFVGVFSFSLLTILASSLLVSFIQVPDQQFSEHSTSQWDDFKASVTHIRKHQVLPILMVLGFVINFFVAGPIGVVIPILAKDILEGNAFVLGMLEVSLGLGFILGSITVSIRKPFNRPGLAILYSLLVMVLAYSALGFVQQLILSMFALLLVSFFIQLMNIPLFTYIQTNTEANMVGKVMSLFISVASGLTPLSFAMISYLLHLHIDIQLIIRIFGAFLIVITAGTFLISPIRNLTYENSPQGAKQPEKDQGVSS